MFSTPGLACTLVNALSGMSEHRTDLEGLNKHYGTQILVSDEIRQACEDQFSFRPVDLVLAKGAITPVQIFELAGYLPDVTGGDPGLTVANDKLKQFEDWRRVYDAYNDRDWKALISVTSDYGDAYPADPLAKLFEPSSYGLVGYQSRGKAAWGDPRPTAPGVLNRLPSRISSTVNSCMRE